MLRAQLCENWAARSHEREALVFRIEAISDPEQGIDQLVFLTEPRIELLEPREVASGGVELAQGTQRLGVTGLDIEHLLPGRGRGGGRTDPIRVHLPELLEQRDRVLPLEDGALTVEDLGERDVALLALVQCGERDERLGVIGPRFAEIVL
ncbi:MAG: hypothetical protein IPQ07_28210 [Myxococcales bacterium]|nr:hypothetical protein [Myxococcales bacterium]